LVAQKKKKKYSLLGFPLLGLVVTTMRLSSDSSFRFMLVVFTVLLLGAELELTGLCHGRRIPSAEAVLAHDVESPPGQGFSNKQQQGSRWRRVQDLSESKRKVPQGPNPLHN